MTQEEKELLLKDLCGRLPHGLYISTPSGDGHLTGITLSPFGHEIEVNINPASSEKFSLDACKPYLHPMESMTIDELDDCVTNDGLSDIPCPNYKGSKEECEQQWLEHSIKVFKTDAYRVDWLDAHQFDHRGLIPMSLALKAPEGMYN